MIPFSEVCKNKSLVIKLKCVLFELIKLVGTHQKEDQRAAGLPIFKYFINVLFLQVSLTLFYKWIELVRRSYRVETFQSVKKA